MTQKNWQVDPTHSQVEFGAKHMMFTTVRGRFKELSGTIEIDTEQPTRSSVDVQIDAASIDTGLTDRDQHLRAEDFLHVEEYPAITFCSTGVVGSVSKAGDEFLVLGELSIRGVTREVELKAVYKGTATDPWGGERIGFEANTSIDRREWGLTWNQPLEAGGVLVGHNIQVELSVQAVEMAEAMSSG